MFVQDGVDRLSTLPAELLAIILADIPLYQWKITFISKSLTPHVNRKVYQNVKVVTEDRVAAFVRFVRANPDLAPLVKHLSVGGTLIPAQLNTARATTDFLLSFVNLESFTIEDGSKVVEALLLVKPPRDGHRLNKLTSFSLSGQFTEWNDICSVAHYRNIFNLAPNVSSVACHASSSHLFRVRRRTDLGTSAGARWPSVTEVRLATPLTAEPLQAADFCNAFPSLEKLTLNSSLSDILTGGEGTIEPLLNSLVLPQLKKLSIGHDVNAVEGSISRLSALETLEVEVG